MTRARCEHGWPWFASCPHCADLPWAEWVTSSGRFKITRFANGDTLCVDLHAWCRLIQDDGLHLLLSDDRPRAERDAQKRSLLID